LSSRKRRSPRGKDINGESVGRVDIDNEEVNGADVNNNEDVSSNNEDVEIISPVLQPRRRLLGAANSAGVSPNS
jgi:hypothetical protein